MASASDVALQAAIDGNLGLLTTPFRLLSSRSRFHNPSHSGIPLFPFQRPKPQPGVFHSPLNPLASAADVTMASASDVALQAAIDGNLGLLKTTASKLNLREAKDDKGRNALHLAAEKGHLEVCRFLVEESGFDVDSVSAEGRGPVHGAAAGGSESVLRYLLDRGGDPLMPDSRGFTPLHVAAEEGHCDAVKLLLSKGVDVDEISPYATPLFMAASKDQDQTLKILLEHGADAGADVNFMIPDGPTVLMSAVYHGLTDIVKFLLEAGADPNIPDKDGRIPIIWAAVHEERELVELLFPRTKPFRYLPNWSVDGIIRSMKLLSFYFKVSQDALLEKELLADPKSRGKEAFVDGEYAVALYLYGLAADKDPSDATLYANLSICWLRLGEGEEALSDAWTCKMMCPGWSKAWYREGAALSFLKNYKGAVDAFMQALKLDPSNDEIKKALREAMEAMRSAARSG